MSVRTLLIEPHDPVIFRDGKPFTQGAIHAKSLPFPLPGTIAGAIRTRSRSDWDFTSKDHLSRLLKIEHTGPFLAVRESASAKWEIAFPAPADVVITGDDKALVLHPLRPGSYGNGGCDLPEGMQPLLGAPKSKSAGKSPPFWRHDRMADWLGRSPAKQPLGLPQLGYQNLEIQKRMHVAIDADTQTASEGMLFGTVGLEFAYGREHAAAIVSRVDESENAAWPAVAPLGGERRLAYWSEPEPAAFVWPSLPGNIPTKQGSNIRLILATPGAFASGWRPAWSDGESDVPGHPGLRLKLYAAAVPRFQPVSGWDLQTGKPKATRFLAPAGSVYFLKVIQGDAAGLWLRPVSDGEQDRRDGYGIALIGAA